MSANTAPDWVLPTMRAGYGARALVYVILGILTVLAAWTGGQTEGTRGALATLKDEPFGNLLLWIIAAGLLCYGVWRLIAAWYDLEDRGDDEEGAAARLALVVTGLAHAGLAFAVAALAMGDTSSGNGAQNWTGKVMALPAGKWIVAAIATAIMGAAIHYAIKGYKRKYEQHIRVTATTRKLDPALRAGFIAYAIVLGIVGAFLLVAALQADPSEAKGIGAALDYVRSQPFGRWLLGLLGIGLVSFGLENAVEAFFRVIPGKSSPDTETLASYARRKANEATA